MQAYVFQPLIILLVNVVMLTAAFVAHRGGSFRGTWLMFAGTLIAFAGGIGNVVVSYLTSRALSPPLDPETLDTLSNYSFISMSSFFAFLVGLLIFLIGTLFLATRYGAISRRAQELEAIGGTLAAESGQK